MSREEAGWAGRGHRRNRWARFAAGAGLSRGHVEDRPVLVPGNEIVGAGDGDGAADCGAVEADGF